MHYPAILVVLFSLTAPVVAETEQPDRYPPVGVPMSLTRVSEHVYFAQGEAGIATDNEGFISNAGVVVTDSGIVVFDAQGLNHRIEVAGGVLQQACAERLQAFFRTRRS